MATDAKDREVVDHPDHYTASDDIECIQAIEAMLGREGFIAYCRGNAMKYNWRCLYKGDTTTDLSKAAWYINRIVSMPPDSNECPKFETAQLSKLLPYDH